MYFTVFLKTVLVFHGVFFLLDFTMFLFFSLKKVTGKYNLGHCEVQEINVKYNFQREDESITL